MTFEPWSNAMKALQLLHMDPVGLGGIWLRARTGPPKDRFLQISETTLNTRMTRISPTISDEALFGGLDFASTLANGYSCYVHGLLDRDERLMALTNAERITPDLAARLAHSLDSPKWPGFIAFDEGLEDQFPPTTLTDRLAFHVSLDGLSASDCQIPNLPKTQGDPATVCIDDKAIRDLVLLAKQLGVSGLRAPLFAIRTAKASCALQNRQNVTSDDLEIAAALVLGPRATMLPADQPPPEQSDQPESPREADQGADHQPNPDTPPEEFLLEAALAALPNDILAKLAKGKSNPSASGTSAFGAVKQGTQRGRPLPPRKAKPDGRKRIDLVATLRAAAPWQPMRRKNGSKSAIHIRPEDVHVRQYQSRSDRLLIFAVDASGSAAFNRLGEAKGAVELLLADAYASRDHVALIAYNKTGAEILLPPTRSLVRTKRQLAKLPGGGGTPLAAGIKLAQDSADTAKRTGYQPALVLIADGKANIDLSGSANRTTALEDALKVARQVAHAGTPGVVIDISKRPEPQLKQVSDALAANYVPLPFVDAKGLSNIVARQLDPA